MSPRRRRAARVLRRWRQAPVLPPADPFRTVDFSPEWQATLQQAGPLTMTSPERVVALIGAVEHVVSAGIDGGFVECGVWRGGSTLAAALTYLRLGETRDLHLFDTFAGMPAPGAADVDLHGVHADVWWDADQQRRAADEHGATEDQVRAAILACGYPPQKLHLIRGMVQDTLPQHAPEAIAVLRLDTDFYDSTRHELRHLWPRLQPGGILIVDDYGHFQGARQAVDEFLAELSPRPFLHRIDYTGRLLVKPL
jgi:O-methyltransferase